MAPKLILHHYDPSPFSEKVRLVLGLKDLAWQSVIVPMMIPKPNLMPLTGGNRRTPTLQIGANIYCGTNLIAAELERRFPQPTIYSKESRGLSAILSLWADEVLFLPTSGYAIRGPENFPPGFYNDRAAMRGQPLASEKVRQAAAHNLEQVQAHLLHVENALSDGRRFILGDDPALADFAVYARVWWAQLFGGDQDELRELPRVQAWKLRVAAIGHGRRTETTPENALAVASGAEPAIPRSSASHRTVRIGMRVSMATERYGPDPVEGEVIAITEDAIALLRMDPQVGRVVVHLPRQGYEISMKDRP